MKYKKMLVSVLALSALLSACTQEDPTKEEAKDIHAGHTEKEHEEYVAKEQQTNEDQTTPSAQNVKIETKLLVKEEGGMFLDISYPELSGMKNSEKQDELNAEFLELAKTIETQTREDEKALVEADAGPHAGGSLDVTTYVNNTNLISLNLTGYQYSGGANGTPFHVPFVYDLNDEKKVSLAELFEGDTLPEKDVLALVNEAMTNSDYGDLLFEPIPTIEPEQPFYLTDDEVVFTFGKYEYTAGAAGAPEVRIEKTKFLTLKKVYQ